MQPGIQRKTIGKQRPNIHRERNLDDKSVLGLTDSGEVYKYEVFPFLNLPSQELTLNLSSLLWKPNLLNVA